MGTGKIDFEVAHKLAIDISVHLSSSMNRIEIAGSIRRRKPVVGDIELVGIPGDQEKLLNLIKDFGQPIKPGVSEIIPWSPKRDAKYVRVRLDAGMNLDLFLARPNNWGGLFLMRTGGATGADGNPFNGFVPRVFKRWKTLSGGGRMTDAMPTTPDGIQLPVPEEQDFFDLLKMDFVPPEERVDHKVIKRYARSDR